MANILTRTAAPALPVASHKYSYQGAGAFTNILRIFFTRIVGVIDNLLSTNFGGKFLYFPLGVFHSTSTQTAALINTAYAVAFATTTLSNDVAIESSSQIHVENDGVYNFQFTAQANAPLGIGGQLTIWLSVSGTNAVNTGKLVELAEPEELVNLLSVQCDFTVTLSSTDYVQVMWAKDASDIQLLYTAATGIYPAIPAASMTVTYMSNS